MISWKKLELPIVQFIVEQIKNENVCRAIASKYNEFRKSRIHADIGDLGSATKRLDEVNAAIANIVSIIERGAAPDSIVQRLVALESEKQSLTNKIEFLTGVDQSEIYVTPGTIKMRFAEIPKLLQQSQPFEVNRALKPILGKQGLRLIRRVGSAGVECYWVVGSINIGKAMTLVQNENSVDASTIHLEIPVEMELG